MSADPLRESRDGQGLRPGGRRLTALHKLGQLRDVDGDARGSFGIAWHRPRSTHGASILMHRVAPQCAVKGPGHWAPGASHRCARGSPHGNTSDTRCSLIPSWLGGAGRISDGLREPKGFHEAGASDAAAATATEHPGYDAAHQNVRQRLVHRRAWQQGTHHQSP